MIHLPTRHRRALCSPGARLVVVLAGSLALAATSAFPHDGQTVRAARASTAISVDGRLDEAAWQPAPVMDGFLQRDPNQGEPASELTELRILYDDRALYVGARLHDREPDEIVRQLSRRDEIAEADSFSVALDPHHDHRTGVLFEVTAAGVQRDAAIYDDNLADDTWDAVWESKVMVDDGGWTVEMRVPLSQLRFPTMPGHSWGVNARRAIHRKNEELWLELVPKNETGLASRMAHLEGIEDVAPRRHVELLPYVSGRGEYIDPDSPGDPFNDGSRHFADAGLDYKLGLGTNMALTGAFNPDFGQVEADPSEVNLTVFETFFSEQRPFFIEGNNILDLRVAPAITGGSFTRDNLFYSRRIGRPPAHDPDPPKGTQEWHVDKPGHSTILGAFKLTGKTAGGLSIGFLESVTGREKKPPVTGAAGRLRPLMLA